MSLPTNDKNSSSQLDQWLDLVSTQHIFRTLTFNLKMYAFFWMIMGIIWCISIIGLFIGIPMLFFSLVLFRSAKTWNTFSYTGNIEDLQESLLKTKQFFLYQNILFLLALTSFIALVFLAWYYLAPIVMPFYQLYLSN